MTDRLDIAELEENARQRVAHGRGHYSAGPITCDQFLEILTRLKEAEAERGALRDSAFHPDSEFVKGDNFEAIHYSQHFIDAMSALTRRKAYDKAECAHLIAEGHYRAEQAESRISELEAALGPLARLEVPAKPQGNAGAYSIFHEDILRAHEILNREKRDA